MIHLEREREGGRGKGEGGRGERKGGRGEREGGERREGGKEKEREEEQVVLNCIILDLWTLHSIPSYNTTTSH